MAAIDDITNLYVGYFNRAPDPAGLNFWVTQYTALGQTPAALTGIANSFSQVPEATSLYGFLSAPLVGSPTSFLASLYLNLFNRVIDTAGSAFWAGQLALPGAAVGRIIQNIISGAQGDDALVVANKSLVGKTFAQNLLDNNAVFSSALAASALTGVTKDAATATAKIATNLTAIQGSAGSAGGSTFTLTSSVDNITGTAGNDTIIAGTQGGQNTLSAGDQIAGGAGTDTLNIFAGTANLGTVTLSGVEIINNSEDASFDVSGIAGVTQATSIGGAGETITATVAQTVGFANTSTGGAATATFNSVTGASDAATIAVNDAGKTTAYTSITVAGIETLTVNATGANKLGTLTAANASKLVFTGAGSVTTALSDNAAYKTIDGSAATGALTIDASAATASAQVLDIKTGTGADTYTGLFANQTKDDKINLGDGTDTLAFADATDLSTSGNVALLAGVTNVEVLRVNGAGAFKVDGDLITQALFNHSSTGAFTGTNFATTDKLTVGAVNIADSTVAMKLGQNTFNLDLAGSPAAASDASKITVTGASTVNVSSAGTSGVANNVLDLVTDSNGTVNVTGSQNLTLTTALNAGTTGLSISGSAFTGKLTVTGTAQADLIVGGTGADTITGGDGTDTVTGGAGADTFAFAVGANAGADGAAVADIITDFVVGTDKLQFTGFADVVSGQQAAVQAAVTALAATATGAQIATAMANANTTDLGVSFAVFGGNTYVYAETTGATTTHVEAANIFIQLTGVTTAPTFAADVIA